MAIKGMSSRHKEIAQLLMRGKKQRDIAKQFHLSEWHVSRIVHSPVFREYLNRLQEQADANVLQS